MNTGLGEGAAVRCSFINLCARFVCCAGKILHVDNLLKTWVLGTISRLDLSPIAANAVPRQIIIADIVTSVPDGRAVNADSQKTYDTHVSSRNRVKLDRIEPIQLLAHIAYIHRIHTDSLPRRGKAVDSGLFRGAMAEREPYQFSF